MVGSLSFSHLSLYFVALASRTAHRSAQRSGLICAPAQFMAPAFYATPEAVMPRQAFPWDIEFPSHSADHPLFAEGVGKIHSSHPPTDNYSRRPIRE